MYSALIKFAGVPFWERPLFSLAAAVLAAAVAVLVLILILILVLILVVVLILGTILAVILVLVIHGWVPPVSFFAAEPRY